MAKSGPATPKPAKTATPGQAAARALQRLCDRMGTLLGRTPIARSHAGDNHHNTHFEAFDPTTALFPGEPHRDDETAHKLPLSSLMEDSARAMMARKSDLNRHAKPLAALISARRSAEVTLITQAVRVLIGIGWLGVAGWLFYNVLTARADGIGVAAGNIPVDDALELVKTFMIVSAAGLGVALGLAALTRLLGNADNKKIKTAGKELGAEIADASSQFNTTLQGLRDDMDKRGAAIDAVDEISRAHVTVLEAWDFYREIEFVTDDNDDIAQARFRNFLASSQTPGGSSALDFLSGALVGAFLVFVLAVPKPEPIALVAPLTDIQYPWAIQLILMGGFLYAGAGALVSLFAGPLTQRVTAEARHDALTALRSEFASRNALRKEDIIARLKDAVDVFRARAGGRSAGGSAGGRLNDQGANQPGANFTTESDIPEWRQRDSSVKFVETGFTGAPGEWRTDAYAKKFEGPETGKTGSKRGPKSR